MTHYENEEEDLLAYFEQMLSYEQKNIEHKHKEIELKHAEQKNAFLQTIEHQEEPEITASEADNPQQELHKNRKFLSAKKSHPQADAPLDKVLPQEKTALENLDENSPNTENEAGSLDVPVALDEHQSLNDLDKYAVEPLLESESPEFYAVPKSPSTKTCLCTTPSLETLLASLGDTPVKNQAALLNEESLEAPAVAVIEQDLAQSAVASQDTAVNVADNIATAKSTEVATDTKTLATTKSDSESTDADPTLELLQANKETTFDSSACNWTNIDLGDEFQVLFFKVKGVRFAVPLIELGGIYESMPLTKIARRPVWYLGLADIRGEKISVVDTMRYVKKEDECTHNYQYMIVLNNSSWALGCDELEGNRVIASSQVKFRIKAGNRPYLAGIVKKEMCALLHVPALISMLNKGLAIEDLRLKQ